MSASERRLQASARARRSSRAIGPVGRASRAVGGTVAIVVPLWVWGATWWDWAAGLVGFPLLAVAAAAALYALRTQARSAAPEEARRVGRGTTFVLVACVLGGATALTYVTPIDGTAVWLFLGASMLLAAAKGYGGCEVLAFPNAVTGR